MKKVSGRMTICTVAVVSLALTGVGCEAIDDISDGIGSLTRNDSPELGPILNAIGQDNEFAQQVVFSDALLNMFSNIESRRMSTQEKDEAQAESKKAIDENFDDEVKETYSDEGVYVAVPTRTVENEEGDEETEYVITDAASGELVSDETYTVPTKEAEKASSDSKKKKKPIQMAGQKVVMMPPKSADSST